MPIKRKKNKEDSVKKYWEVVAPEPFILDPEVVDEQFISDVASLEKDEDVTDYVTNSLHQPCFTFLVFCSKNELYKNFTGETDKISYKVSEYNDALIIVVTDKEKNEPIGRGEIIPIGGKFTMESSVEFMNNHISDFYDRFKKGQKRIDGIMYKIKTLRAQMSKLAPMSSGSKNLLS